MESNIFDINLSERFYFDSVVVVVISALDVFNKSMTGNL